MPLEREKPKRKIFRRGPYLENFYPKKNVQAVDGMLMKIIRRFGYDSPKTTQLIEFWARRKSGVLQKLLKNYVHKETKIIPKQEFVQFANNFDLYFCGGSNVTKTYWEQAKIGLGILYKDLKKQNPALFKRLEDYVTKKQVHKQRESSLYSENLDDFYDAYLLFRRNGLLNHHIWR